MLSINDITYRIGGRILLEGASAIIPAGHKVGLVGRNGTGKSTLLKLILGELSPEDGETYVPRGAKIGTVAQEAPGGSETLIEVVMAGEMTGREAGRLLLPRCRISPNRRRLCESC